MNNIPRYIYHLTLKNNYEQMIKDRCIKVKKQDPYISGIFAIELPNFFKRWRNNPSWDNENLQFELLKKISLRSDIVILRIPTKKLDINKLKIRSQNMFYDFLQNPLHRKYFLPEEREAAYNFIKENSSEETANHLTGMVLAKQKAGHYKRRKEAIEYVYQADIPIEEVEKIGSINIKVFKKSASYNPLMPVRSIFMELLKNTREMIGATFLKN